MNIAHLNGFMGGDVQALDQLIYGHNTLLNS